MKSKLLTGWSLIWLLATVLLVAGGALNLLQRGTKQFPPTDGISWVQKEDGIYAEKVLPNSAGARAYLIEGDKIIGISLDEGNFEEIVSPADVQMYLEKAGIGGSLTYFYQRTSYSLKENYYYADLRKLDSAPRWTPSIILMAFVGVVWLLVGAFVLFRQGSNAPFILHFATLCVAAFVFHVYKSIGQGEDFDMAVIILDDFAFTFFTPIFLHFCLRYPTKTEILLKNKWNTFLIYAPAVVIFLLTIACYLSFSIDALTGWAAFIDHYNILGNLYNISFIHFISGISIGGAILGWRFFTNKQPLVKQRLKWMVWGTLAAVFPIVAFQILKGFVKFPNDSMVAVLTILPLALIPLSFGHSVIRYRLMDVDIVVRRLFVYILTTITITMMVAALALGLIAFATGNNFADSENILTPENALRVVIATIAMAAIILLSEPLRKFLQERADRFFYGERYDMRRGLVDFGRTLTAATGLESLTNSLIRRLQEVLAVEKVALFIEDEKAPSGYRLAKSVGIGESYSVPPDFRQMIRRGSAESGIVRADELNWDEAESFEMEAIVRHELHYYAPCVVRGRMVAVIGLGRARDGSLLSSEDLEILQTVSGYVAVAIENNLLYEEQAKRANELETLKEFSESIVESVNVGLLAVDENGLVTRSNTTFEEMLELRREDIVGKQVVELFDEGFSANLLQMLGKSRWHLQEIRHAYKFHTSNSKGKSLILNVAVAPLRTISKGQKGAIVILENVTSRVKLEETLQQSEKLSSIGLLAAGVAHEVNTPLTGVSSYTQMLLGMIPETDPKHALLLKVQKQTERASNIAGNLLNFSRVGGTAEFTEINLNKTLDNTLQLLEIQLRKSQIEIVKNYSENLPEIYGNAGKLQQVFTNIILNARDAMYEGGSITLTTNIAEDNESVIIEIADNGSGIEPENLSKIFDPFFTTKAIGSGTGLGLAVAYGIIQEHSGTVETTSELGRGTTFRLEFPIAEKRRQRAVS